jgi:hypothetical protein
LWLIQARINMPKSKSKSKSEQAQVQGEVVTGHTTSITDPCARCGIGVHRGTSARMPLKPPLARLLE